MNVVIRKHFWPSLNFDVSVILGQSVIPIIMPPIETPGMRKARMRLLEVNPDLPSRLVRALSAPGLEMPTAEAEASPAPDCILSRGRRMKRTSFVQVKKELTPIKETPAARWRSLKGPQPKRDQPTRVQPKKEPKPEKEQAKKEQAKTEQAKKDQPTRAQPKKEPKPEKEQAKKEPKTEKEQATKEPQPEKSQKAKSQKTKAKRQKPKAKNITPA